MLGGENVSRDEPMSAHTTFRVGGPADYFVTPRSEEALAELAAFVTKEGLPHYILGNGSNLLVGDKGYRGVMIQVGRGFDGVRVEGEVVYAQAGISLARLALAARQSSLSGLEFASGIPGTLGGAVMMNAGAYGGEMKQVVVSVRALAQSGEIREIPAEGLEFGYRTSIFARNGDVILGAVLKLEKGDGDQIQKNMDELKRRRVEKQPLEYPSAGSTFKRPEGHFAGKLIEEAGLRGFSVGGAQVSEKHCGFVVNKGGATAADIASLMDRVAERVERHSGVRLRPEVRRVGEF
jgi:UDP-N-acetylmuramate dehydrogenase